MLQKLQEQGYCHFKNVFTPKQVEKARSCMSSDRKQINYEEMEHFIYDIMLKFINQSFQWDTVLTKYRVSDNNNSSDAGSFHRDVIKYDEAPQDSCFTCLTYLDDSSMELIPRSHLLPHMSYWQAWQHFQNNRVKLRMNVGDVLLFQCTLLHRGIFTENLPHRRLIQCFEVFPNRSLYKQTHPFLFRVPAQKTSQQASGLLEWVYRQETFSNLLNYFGYFNAATGYGYKKGMPQGGKRLLYSSEGTRPRLIPFKGSKGSDGSRWQPNNQYIIKQKDAQTVPEHQVDELRWQQYNNQFTRYGALLLFLVFFFIAFLYLFFFPKCKVKKRRKNEITYIEKEWPLIK
jgi:hypothetical protein